MSRLVLRRTLVVEKGHNKTNNY